MLYPTELRAPRANFSHLNGLRYRLAKTGNLAKFQELRRTSKVDGLTPEEFHSFGATRRTLRQFIAACYDLNAIVRDFQIP
jgi:hypothetical protein